MDYNEQLVTIELSNKIFACNSHKHALERELADIRFRHQGIPAKKEAARHSMYIYGIVSILLTLFVLYCISLIVPILARMIIDGTISSIGAVSVVLMLPGTLVGMIGCFALWKRTFRCKVCINSLESEVPVLENRMQNIHRKMNELRVELEELHAKQKKLKTEKNIQVNDVMA